MSTTPSDSAYFAPNYGTFALPKINCPKHGVHEHIITSTIIGHTGQWCQICWLETLGPSLSPQGEEVEA